MATTREDVDMQVETPAQEEAEQQPKMAERGVSEQLQDRAEPMPVDQVSEGSSVGTVAQPTAAQPPPLPSHSSSSHSETLAGDKIYKHLMSDCSEVEEEVISGPYSVLLDMGSEMMMDSVGDHARHPRRVSWAEYKQRRKSATERRDSGGHEPQHQGVGETATQQKTGLKSLESPEKAQHIEHGTPTVTSDSLKMADSQSPLAVSKESPGKEKGVRREMASSTNSETQTTSLGSQKLSPVISRTIVKQSPDSKPQLSQDATEKVSHSPDKQKVVLATPIGGSVSAAKESVGDPRTVSSLPVSPTAPTALASAKLVKEKEKAPSSSVQRTADTVVSEKEPVAGTSKGAASTKDVIGRVPPSQPSVSVVQRFSIPVHQGGSQPIAPHTHEPIAPPHPHGPIAPPRQHEPIVPQHQHEPNPHFLLPPPHSHPPPHGPPGPHGSWFPPSAWTRNVLGPPMAPPPPQPWGPYSGYFHPHQHSGYPPYGPFPPGISPDDIPPPPPDELASRSPSPSISSSHSSRSLSRSGTPTGDDSPAVVDDAERGFELTPSTSDATTQATCRTSSQLIQVGSGFKFRSMSTQTVRRPLTRSLAIQVNMDPKMYSKRVQTNPPHIVSSFTQTVCKTRSRGVQTVPEPEPPKPLHPGLEALKLMVADVEFGDGEEIVRNLRNYLARMIGLGSNSDSDLSDMSCDNENEDDVFEGDDQTQLGAQPGIPSPVISGASNISEGDLSDLFSEGSPSGKASATSEPHTPLHPLDPDETDSHGFQHRTVLDGKSAASTENKSVGTETPCTSQVEATTAVDTKADCSTPPPLPPLPPPPLPSSVPPLPPFPAPSLPPLPPPPAPSDLPTLPEGQTTGSPCPPKQQHTLEISVSATSHQIQESLPPKQLQLVAPLPPIQEEPSVSIEKQQVQMHALETACPLDFHNEEFDDSPGVCYVRCMSLPPFKLSGSSSSGRPSSTNGSSNRSTPTSSPGTEFPVPTDSARIVADHTTEDAVQVGTSQRACSSSPPTARRFRKKLLTKEELLAIVRAKKPQPGGASLEAAVEDPQKREAVLETRAEEGSGLELGKKSSIDMDQLMVNFRKHMAEVKTRKVQDSSWIKYHPSFSAQYPTIPYHGLPMRFVPVGFEHGCHQLPPSDTGSLGSQFQTPGPTQDTHTAESRLPMPSTEDLSESRSSDPAAKPDQPEPQMSEHSPPLVADDSGIKPGQRSLETSGEGGIHALAESVKEPLENGTSLPAATANISAGHDQSTVTLHRAASTSEECADKELPVPDSILESEKDTLDCPTPDAKPVNLSPSSVAETPNTMYYSVPATPETAGHTPTEWFTPSAQFGQPMVTRRARRSMLGLAAVESPYDSPGERTIPEEDAKEGECVSSGTQVVNMDSPNQSQRFREVVFPGVIEHSADVTAREVTAGEVTAGEVTAGEVTVGEVTAGEATAGEVPPLADNVRDTDQQALAEEEGDDGEGTGAGGCGGTKDISGRTDFDASPEILRGGDKEDFSYSKVESPLPLQSPYTDPSLLNVPAPLLPAGAAVTGGAMEFSDEDEVQQRKVGNRYIPSLQCADTPNVFLLEVESADSVCDESSTPEDCEAEGEPAADSQSLEVEGEPAADSRSLQAEGEPAADSQSLQAEGEPAADSRSLEPEHSTPSQLVREFQSDEDCRKQSDTSVPLGSPAPFSSGDALETTETTIIDCSKKGGQVIEKDVGSPSTCTEVCGADTSPQEVDQQVAETAPQGPLVVSFPRASCVLTRPGTNFPHNRLPSPETMESSEPPVHCIRVEEGFPPLRPPLPACDRSVSHSETPQFAVHETEGADHGDESHDSFFHEVATPELQDRLTHSVEVPSSPSQCATTPLTHSFRMSSFKQRSPTSHECPHTPLTSPQPSLGEFISLSPEKEEGDECPVGVSETRQPSSETVLVVEITKHTVGRSPQHETPPSSAHYQMEHSMHDTPTEDGESVPSRVLDLEGPQAEVRVVSESVQDQTEQIRLEHTSAATVKSKGMEEDQVEVDNLKPVELVLPAGQFELVLGSETGGEGHSKQLDSSSQSKSKDKERAEAIREGTGSTSAGYWKLIEHWITGKHISSQTDPKPTGFKQKWFKLKETTESDEELEEGEIIDTSDNEPPRDADIEVIDSAHSPSPAAVKAAVVDSTEDILSKSFGVSILESEAPTIEMAVCDNPAQPPLPQSPPPTHVISPPPPLPTTPPLAEAAPNMDTSDSEHSSSIRLGKRSPKTQAQGHQPPPLLSPKSPPQPFGPNVQPFGPNPASQPRPLFESDNEAAPMRAPLPLFPVQSPQTWMLPSSSCNQSPGLSTMALQPTHFEGSTTSEHPKPLPLMITRPTSLVLPIHPLMQERHLDGGRQPPCLRTSPPHIPPHSRSSLLSGTSSTPCPSSGSSSQRPSSDSHASSSSTILGNSPSQTSAASSKRLSDSTLTARTLRSSSDSQVSISSSILGNPPSQETKATSSRRLSSPSPSLRQPTSGSDSLSSQSGPKDSTITACNQRSISDSQPSGSSSILGIGNPPSQETKAASSRSLSSPSPSLRQPTSGSESLSSQSGPKDSTVTAWNQRSISDSQASSSSSILRKPLSQAAPPRRLSSPSPSLHRPYHHSLDDRFPTREAELDLLRLHSPYAPPPPPHYRYHRSLPPPLPPAPRWHDVPPVRHRREFPYDLDSPPFDGPQFGPPRGGYYTYRYF